MARQKKNKRIRFLSDQIYETQGPGKGIPFAKGTVLSAEGVGIALGIEDAGEFYTIAFLRRWVSRGVAEYVDADATGQVPDIAGGADILVAAVEPPISLQARVDPETQDVKSGK